VNFTKHARAIIPAFAFVAGTPSAWSAITLAADEAPVDPPWTQPANFSWVREKGSTTATADLVLRYRSEVQRSANEGFASQGSYGFGVYLHRDNAAGAVKNDRGLQASYSGLLVPDWGNAGPVGSLGYSLKASTGKGLVDVDQPSGSKIQVDKTKNRIVFSLGGFLQPKMSGAPMVGRVPAVLFLDGGPSLYFDESRGQGVMGTGHVTGASFKLAVNYAPLGLEPKAVGGLALVPTMRLAAQTQRDLDAAGSRMKKTRNLYSLELNLLFAQPDTATNKLIPSLQLSRSVGADLLTGRADTAKTELSFGLTF